MNEEQSVYIHFNEKETITLNDTGAGDANNIVYDGTVHAEPAPWNKVKLVSDSQKQKLIMACIYGYDSSGYIDVNKETDNTIVVGIVDDMDYAVSMIGDFAGENGWKMNAEHIKSFVYDEEKEDTRRIKEEETTYFHCYCKSDIEFYCVFCYVDIENGVPLSITYIDDMARQMYAPIVLSSKDIEDILRISHE